MKQNSTLFRTRAIGLLLILLTVLAKAFAQQAGNIDTSFNPTDSGFDNPNSGVTGISTNNEPTAINCSLVQPDGKILIGGYFDEYNGVPRNNIARVNADGTLDTSFNPGSGAEYLDPYSTGRVTSIVLQADGKIIIGGMFTHYNGVTRRSIARLLSDGTIDSSFTVGSGFDDPNQNGGWGPGYINSIILQPDGKIVAGGMFAEYNGIAKNQIARLHSDGSLDSTFQEGEGLNYYGIWGLEMGIVDDMVLQPDGKILVAGLIQSYNSVNQNGIVRINSDGSLDTSFNGNSDKGRVKSIALQPDGKILIGGRFSKYNGINRSRIARLNADGTLDQGFLVTGANGDVNTVALQTDGKVLVGGIFTTFNGSPSTRLARLNNDGSLDTTFATGTGANNNVRRITLQSDGKLIISGLFTAYNGTGRNRLARLYGSAPLTPAASITTSTIASPVLYPDSVVQVPFTVSGTFDSVNVFTAQLSDASGSFASPVTIGSLGGMASAAINALIPSAQAPGSAYRIRVIASAPYTIGTDNGTDLSLQLPPNPTVLTDSLSGLILTRGAMVAVPFTVTGSFASVNVFTAQLSDAAGSFASPDTIGTLTGTQSDTIIGVISANQPAGTQYRIRVIASAPAITGTDNGQDLALVLPPAAPGMISGKMSSVCMGTTESYSVAPVPGASSYTWTVPADADLLSGQGTTSVTVNFISGFVSGKLTVAAVNAAGSSTTRTLSITSVLPTPGAISGPTSEVCAGSSEQYSIAPVSGASSYNWKVPAGASIISGQGSTSVTVAFTSVFAGGNLSVAAVNSCGESMPRARSVRSSTVTPGAISGVHSGVCQGSVESYSIAAVSGAIGYHWAAPYGASIISGQGTTAVSVSFGANFVSGNVQVSALNSCGASPARGLGIRSTPATPGVITGAATVCKNQVNVSYSIAAVAGVTSYTWTVPTGATIVSGQGTTSLTLSYGAATGTYSLSVKASNGCGLSAARTLGITVNSCVREMAPQATELVEFSVYPNPSKGEFTVNYSALESGSSTLQLFDMTGRLVKQQTIVTTEGSNSVEVNGADLPKGIYLVELISGTEIQRQRMVIE